MAILCLCFAALHTPSHTQGVVSCVFCWESYRVEKFEVKETKDSWPKTRKMNDLQHPNHRIHGKLK